MGIESIRFGNVAHRTTRSPEVLSYRGNELAYDHPSAVAFCVLQNEIVAMAPAKTHLEIFNALRAAGKPAQATLLEQTLHHAGGAEAIYKEFGITFYPQIPKRIHFDWFLSGVEGLLGEKRKVTLAGRIWKNVDFRNMPHAVISFWVSREAVSLSTLTLLAQAFHLRECLVEFQGSARSEIVKFRP